MSADQKFLEEALWLGFPVEAEVVAGGSYAPALLQGEYLLISGQVPRVTRIVSIGAVGDQVSLEQRSMRLRFARCGRCHSRDSTWVH